MSTPRSKSTANPTTPTGNRLQSSIIQASPHYTTTRRHSLYGTEDRIVIDPGSRVWKVGFSGEGRPRDVFFAVDGEKSSLWALTCSLVNNAREEEDRMLRVQLQKHLRRVFYEYVEHLFVVY